jgi:iron(II)-dependent oxidoreductase
MNKNNGKVLKIFFLITWLLLFVYFILDMLPDLWHASKPDLEKEKFATASVVEELILIPAGEFLMGSDSDGDHNPAHNVYIDSFYIDKYEVTNAQYLEFCEATDHKLPQFWGKDEFRSGPGYPDHPVIGLSWRDAAEYAKWRGKRLPTEAEWEYAARGGLVGKKYPNGDTLDPSHGNHSKSELGGPMAVGSYAANGYGLHDMQGNVLEWVQDYYEADYYSSSPTSNPKGPEAGRFRIMRGGGWYSGPYCNQVHFRNALPENWVDFNLGFRCAKDVEQPGDSR